MTDAGFFRGTSADQDNRFADKQKKMLKELNHSPILNTKLNMSKIDIEDLRPWIEDKIKEILEKDDDILSESIFEHLTGKEPDGKNLLLLLTGLVEEDNKASKFMEELWTKLLDIQQNSNGISPKSNIAASPGNGLSTDRKASESSAVNTIDDQSGDLANADQKQDGLRQSRSRSRTPHAPESGSKDRSQPRSKSHSPHKSRSKSKDGSKSPSKSPSKSNSRSRSRSRSHSQRRPSVSRSRSTSKSRQSRGRFRRSRSRSSSYTRGRRGYIPRGSYRGYGYPERRRGASGPIRPTRARRPISPPWARRRSPIGYRRRRTPSRSPRRTYRSHSKSPPYGHMMGRRSPRPPFYSSGPMGPRHVPPHDVHRPVVPSASPRRPPSDYTRSYNDPSVMAGHSSAHMMGRSHDLPPKIHGISSGPSRPYEPGPYSPNRSSSSERRRHKKEKKHRKHKKSKKRRSSSSSPDRRKKHKKHKKSKKHKS